jgi:hypothetical protein
MNRSNAPATLLYSTILLTAMAGARPPDIVQSDPSGNTAMGTGALNTLGNGPNGTSGNTAVGMNALFSTPNSQYNTAVGQSALFSNITGAANTGIGIGSLTANTTGNYNTAIGASSLSYNTESDGSTAVGYATLYSSTGSHNTAMGFTAMSNNGTGYYNSAFGEETLLMNGSGNYNTAIGANALLSNVTGSGNTALGASALHANTGQENTASGASALYGNTTGGSNTAIGQRAMHSNTTGSNNIAVGASAGENLTTGSNNIDIGSRGIAGDKSTIRIGTPGIQSTAFVAGILGSQVTGSAVYVTSAGQLGVLASSERYKTQIAPMGSDTDGLQRLRPVTFRLKADPRGSLQYGLIAEEVAKVYPELVIRDAAGRIEGVRYDELAPMLLNELKRQKEQMADMRKAVTELKQESELMRAVLLRQQVADESVASR